VKISAKLATAVAVTIALPGLGYAQAPKAKSAPAAPVAQATPTRTAPSAEAASAPAGWVARCASASRGAPLECAVEQTAVLTKTGQLIVLINIRVPDDTHTPVAGIQLPLGLNLPASAKPQVNDGKMVDLQIQTCEQRGCYVNTPIALDMLAAMKTGKVLKVSFQNRSKEVIAIPMPLTDFAAA
jgi:invasion protein IalB